MNIAIATTEFVNENNFHGGLANYTYKLAKWLVLNDNTVTVFLPVNSNQQEQTIDYEGITLIKVPITDNQWHYKYKFEKLGLSFLMNKKKYYRMYFEELSKCMNASILKQHRFSKFHIVQYPNNGGMAFDCPTQIPSIIRLSGLTAKSHEYGGYGNTDISVFEQEKFEAKGLMKASAIFCPSKMTIEITKKTVNRKFELIETPFIKPALTLDDSIYKRHWQNKTYILFFGSIGIIKGIGTIAEIIFDLLEQQPNLHFVFVGKKLSNQINNMPIWDYLIDKARQHQNRIIHLEPLKHHQLFPIIQHAECVVLPSRIDNFPNTCIEAMANSKIVIGTVGNGFDQLIDDEKSGFVIPVDDSLALLKTITHVLNLSVTEKKIIELAAKQRTDLLHPDIVLNQVVDLYKQTIANFKN